MAGLGRVHEERRRAGGRQRGGDLVDAGAKPAAGEGEEGKGPALARLQLEGRSGEPRGEIEGVPLLYGMAPFEGLSVGRDPRSPVGEATKDGASVCWGSACSERP